MHTINPILQEQATASLKQIGLHIQRARKEAFRESREAFSQRLGCAPMTLDRLERGEPGVAAIYLVAALQAMQVLHDAVAATSPALLIATTIPPQFPPGFAGG
ncbi:hypothetical protein [Paucibacter soli]|uniref:hypothetical protein n=1 Tax=Paucibacter soli TaxID=3133433 RepID=UPI0030B20CA7